MASDVWELPRNGQGIAALRMLRSRKMHKSLAAIEERWDWMDSGIGLERSWTKKEWMLDGPLLMKWQPRDFWEYADRHPRSARARRPLCPHLFWKSGASKKVDTIYMTVADAEGNMIFDPSKVNYHRGMGSGMTPDGLGLILQRQGTNF